jgi:hypothetical protein
LRIVQKKSSCMVSPFKALERVLIHILLYALLLGFRICINLYQILKAARGLVRPAAASRMGLSANTFIKVNQVRRLSVPKGAEGIQNANAQEK